MKTTKQIELMVIFSLFEFTVMNGGQHPAGLTGGQGRASGESESE